MIEQAKSQVGAGTLVQLPKVLAGVCAPQQVKGAIKQSRIGRSGDDGYGLPRNRGCAQDIAFATQRRRVDAEPAGEE